MLLCCRVAPVGAKRTICNSSIQPKTFIWKACFKSFGLKWNFKYDVFFFVLHFLLSYKNEAFLYVDIFCIVLMFLNFCVVLNFYLYIFIQKDICTTSFFAPMSIIAKCQRSPLVTQDFLSLLSLPPLVFLLSCAIYLYVYILS